MKKIKTSYLILYVFLMLLPLILTLAALPHLPEEIPAHYGFSGQVDRWGSKYEALLFPVITICFGALIALIAWLAAHQEKSGTNNLRTCVISGLLGLALFNAMNLFFLYTAFAQTENLNALALDIYQIMFLLLGLTLLVLGNIMPKVRMNSLVGLRTKWSMKNEQVWKKCQRFGGISLMITGILTILVSLLTGGILCFILSLTLILGDWRPLRLVQPPRRRGMTSAKEFCLKKKDFIL